MSNKVHPCCCVGQNFVPFSGWIKAHCTGLLWWLSGKKRKKKSICQCKTYGFDPWSGKIPHAMEQPSLWATAIEPVLKSLGAPTTEPMCCNCWSLWARKPELHSKRNHCNQKPVHVTGVLIRKGKFGCTGRMSCDNQDRYCSDASDKPRNAKSWWPPPEARKRQGRILPSLRGIIALLVPWLRTSSLQNVKVKVLVTHSCPTLFNPLDCSLPGSSVYGILQARIQKWIAIPFSGGSFWPRDQVQVFCIAGRFFTIWATREATHYIHC